MVAAFLYIIVSWLRQSRSGSGSRRVIVVGIPLLAVYLLATTFHLFLVESLVRLLLLVLLLALVVVFQSDLRRLLDRIGSWGFKKRGEPPRAGTPDVLTDVAARLAETRTGALIAIRGEEPWDSHVEGGVDLDGVVTRPLLQSIFSPETPGHDGAVLVDGERAMKFGVHLPLSSRRLDVTRAGGTRHAAALGLAEECDALVIVVSEERGTISIAQNRELIELPSAAELRGRLDEFWRRHYTDKAPADRSARVKHRLENAGISLALAAAAWLIFAYSAGTVRRTFQVPIAFRDVPPEWVLENETMLNARVALAGPEHAFRALDPDQLVISLDLPEPEPGANEMTIGEDNLDLPDDLILADVNPQSITVIARRQRAFEVTVAVRTVRAPPDSIMLVAQPASVTVLVPEGMGSPPARILTEPIDLQRATTDRIQTRLALPDEVRLYPDESLDVTIRVMRKPRRSSTSP